MSEVFTELTSENKTVEKFQNITRNKNVISTLANTFHETALEEDSKIQFSTISNKLRIKIIIKLFFCISYERNTEISLFFVCCSTRNCFRLQEFITQSGS